MKRRIHINGLVYVGAMILVYGSIVLFKAYESHQWPTSNGVITRSEVYKKTQSSSSKSGGSHATYHARVEYEYTVDNVSYSSSRISFGARKGDQAHQTVAYYYKGKQIEVYYNPLNPADSVLKNTISLGVCTPLIMGALITALGIYATGKGGKGAV